MGHGLAVSSTVLAAFMGCLNAGQREAAGRLFVDALSLDPPSAAAREGLARARSLP